MRNSTPRRTELPLLGTRFSCFTSMLDMVDELNWDIASLVVISAYLEKLVETATEKDEGGIEGMFLSAHQIEELSTGVAACIRNINRTLGEK